jgi:hypothetical protein
MQDGLSTREGRSATRAHVRRDHMGRNNLYHSLPWRSTSTHARRPKHARGEERDTCSREKGSHGAKQSISQSYMKILPVLWVLENSVNRPP